MKSENDASSALSAPSEVSTSSSITGDIEELRKHLVRLQTYVMETNAKLQDMLFSGNGTSLVNFHDIFSDSHPTPPTLMGTTPEEELETEPKAFPEGSNAADGVANIVVPINDPIQTADNDQ
jgi:hypothetical protein